MSTNQQPLNTFAGATTSEPRNVTSTTIEQPEGRHQRKSPPALFFKNRDVVGYIEPNRHDVQELSNEEVYKQLSKQIRTEYIFGIQKIGGLWRLHINDTQSKYKLLASGFDIRGKNVTIYEHNPFLRTERNTVLVRVCDIPLSVHDQEIVSELRSHGLGIEIVGECTREKLRVGGQLTNCYTGNRRLEIKIPKEPLPRFIAINDFRARVYHNGQPETKDVTCINCLEKGHYSATCRKERKCTECKGTYHNLIHCPVVIAKRNQENKSETNDKQTTSNSQTQALSPSILANTAKKDQVPPSTKPKQQGFLKLKAGKIAVTRNPHHSSSDVSERKVSYNHDNNDESDTADEELLSNNGSGSSDTVESGENDKDGDYSSLSAKTPSPDQRAKRKQKNKKKKRGRQKSSKGK